MLNETSATLPFPVFLKEENDCNVIVVTHTVKQTLFVYNAFFHKHPAILLARKFSVVCFS